VIACLLISLLECLLMLPAHLSHLPENSGKRRGSGSFGRVNAAFRCVTSGGLEWFVENVYAPFLMKSLSWCYVSLFVAFTILLLTVGMIRGGILKFEVFNKLDAELGRMLGIGAVKGVEVGAGFKVKDMTGIQCNDQMNNVGGKVDFASNNAGGITGGLTTGQDIVVRLAVKPTPTIDKDQNTVDKYTLESKKLSAITRRDPTITGRIWPIAENFTAMILLDNLMSFYGQGTIMEKIGSI